MATTTPYGNFEQPFNLPYLVESCGATYVARWTALHVRQLTVAINEALLHSGLPLHRGHLALPDRLRAGATGSAPGST